MPVLAEAFLRAADGAAEDLRTSLLTQAPGVVLQSRSEETAAIRAAPVVVAVSVGVAAVVLGAIAYAALAVAAALALAGSARRIEGAHLRALGLSERQGFGLVLLEHWPAWSLSHSHWGWRLGVGLFVFLRPGLGLAAVVGSAVDVPVSVEPAWLLAMLVTVVAILAVGLGLGGRPGAACQRRKRNSPRHRMMEGVMEGPTPHAPRAAYGHGALIVCDNLVRIFKIADLEAVALQGLDLVVDPGEMVAVIGASGSGKSTLLNILGGQDLPTAGQAIVADHDLGRLNGRERTRYRRRVVGMIWQQTARNLLPYLDAAANVELPMILDGRAHRRERALELLDLVGMASRAGAHPGAPLGRRAAARRHRGGTCQRAGRRPRRRAHRRARQHHRGRGLQRASSRRTRSSAPPWWSSPTIPW